MDLVDEKHVAFLELGEDRSKVAGPLERRTGRDVHANTHLRCNDAGHRGLTQAWWACQQQVVGGLAAQLGSLQHNREVLLQLALADELTEPARS